MISIIVSIIAAAFCLSNAFAKPDAATIFQNIRPQVFQVKTAVSKDSPKSSYGTGFAVSRHGLIATNYHVVSQGIEEDGKYQIFVMVNEESIPAQIVEVDVIHDLALIQIDHRDLSSNYLIPINYEPRQGIRIFSLGLPQDLNMSIVEGLYNGILHHGKYETVHVSVPMNGGMSGGPALDEEKKLIGINVAAYLFSQNISFLVPAHSLYQLIVRHKARKIAAQTSDLHSNIQTQLLEVQDKLTTDIVESGDTKNVKAVAGKKPRDAKSHDQTNDQSGDQSKGKISLPGWNVFKPKDYLKCWSVNNDSYEKLYRKLRHICHLNHAAFVSKGIATGSFEISYIALSSDQLNSLRFSKLVEENSGSSNWISSEFLNYHDQDSLLTRRKCEETIVTNVNKVLMKIEFCARGYVRYPKIFDAEFKLTTLEKPTSALISKAIFKGFTIESLRRIAETWIQAVEPR